MLRADDSTVVMQVGETGQMIRVGMAEKKILRLWGPIESPLMTSPLIIFSRT
jgi:hypothetical protein